LLTVSRSGVTHAGIVFHSFVAIAFVTAVTAVDADS
jgi:hypothetical protein